MAEGNNPKPALDINTTLDHMPFTLYQRLIVFFAALAVILDGFDSQLIGYAAPALMREWGLTKNEFMPSVVAGVLGSSVGAITGIFADYFGRKRALIGYMLTFGLFTSLVATQNSILGIAIFRFIAGIGIGGALPIATTIAAEFTPQRYRTMVVTATIVCVPLGGVVTGFFAEVIMPDFGWRTMFLIGGAMPIALMIFCIVATPETPKYLVGHPERWPELRRILKKWGRWWMTIRRSPIRVNRSPQNGPVMERFFVITWHAIHPRFGVHFSFVWHLYMLLSVGCRQCWPRLIYRRMWRGRA